MSLGLFRPGDHKGKRFVTSCTAGPQAQLHYYTDASFVGDEPVVLPCSGQFFLPPSDLQCAGALSFPPKRRVQKTAKFVGKRDQFCTHGNRRLRTKPGGVIAVQDAVDFLAQERGQTQRAAFGVDDEDGDVRGRRRPQPTQFAPPFPTCLVGELQVGFAHRLESFLMGRRDGGADFLFEIGDGPACPRRADWRTAASPRWTRWFSTALPTPRGVVPSRRSEHPARRSQSMPVHPCRHVTKTATPQLRQFSTMNGY